MNKQNNKMNHEEDGSGESRPPSFQGYEPFVDIGEVEKFLRVERKTLYKWTSESRNNSFPFYKIGRCLKFRLSQIDRWANKYLSSEGVKEFLP